MDSDKLKIGLVLDEYFMLHREVTALTIAELGPPIEKGATICEPSTGCIYEVWGRGFRPKRGGMEGLVRSELSREASLMIKGKAKSPLVGRFLVLPNGNLTPWMLTVRIDTFLQDHIAAPCIPNVLELVIGTPVVVAVGGEGHRTEAVGVLVPSRVSDSLVGDLWLFAESGCFPVGKELLLGLGSPALASEVVFRCMPMSVSTGAEALTGTVCWPAEV